MQNNENITHIPTPSNFVYPEIKETDYCFGSGQLRGTVLREDGDWRDYTPPSEEQRRHGVESSSCFIQAQQHVIATILKEQYGIADSNFSERYNLIYSYATENGGSPLVGAASIRHDGLIPDIMLPFSDDIASWKEFNSFKGADEIACVKTGQEWLDIWAPLQDIVFTKKEQIEIKYAKIREALKYGPLPVSVTAWYVDNKTGLYMKPEGEIDAHLVELVYLDENNSAYIFDTYPPFIKKLDPFFNFDFCMRWTVEKVPAGTVKPNWASELIKQIINFFRDIFKI